MPLFHCSFSLRIPSFLSLNYPSCVFDQLLISMSWETSKENYKPLKSGRLAAPLNGSVNLATLTSGGSLISCNSNQKSIEYDPNIEEMKSWFEEKIKINDGKDPLDYWYRYVKWFEQTFPTGKDKEMRKIAFDCIKRLKDRTEYLTRDRRWWYICYKAASLSTNGGSLSIYQVMYEQGQCKEVADFYKQWGHELEQAENFTEARRIYNLGIKAAAQPIADLHNARQDLEVKVSRKLCEPSEDEDYEDTRQILGVLKGVGKQATAPVIRQTIADKTRLVNQQPIAQNGRIGFGVFDENSSSIKSTASISKATNNVPLSVIRQDNREENFREPNLWPKEKIKATAKVTPVQNSTNFLVFDEAEEFKIPTVEKKTSLAPLSFSSKSTKQAIEPAVKKLEFKQISSLKSVATSKSSTEFKEVHAWNVKQIYNGSIEMSNEEILAEKWFAKHKVDAHEIEQVDMEETACLTTAIQVVNRALKYSFDDKENMPIAVINSYSTSNRDCVNDSNEACFDKHIPCPVPQRAINNNKSLKIGDRSTTANYSFTTKLNRDLLMAFNKSISLNLQASNEECSGEDNNVTAFAPPLPVHVHGLYFTLLEDVVKSPCLACIGAGAWNIPSYNISVCTLSSIQAENNSFPAYEKTEKKFKIFDENSDTNAAKNPTSQRNPLCAKECDKENIKPVICQMIPKRHPSGILTPVKDIIVEQDSDSVRENKKTIFKLDDSYDYTVAGTSKPFCGSRAISTPFKDKDVGRSLMFSFSMIKPDIGNESCVETDYANTEVSLSKQPDPKVVNQSQKIFEYQQVESCIGNKLSTIAEENSRDFRSSSSSSSSSSNASSGVDYCNNNRKRFISSSNLFTISENQTGGGALSLTTANQTNSTTS